MRTRKLVRPVARKRFVLVELIGGRRGRGNRGRLIFWTLGGAGAALDWRADTRELLEKERRVIIALVNRTIDAHARVRAREKKRRIARADDCMGHPWTHREIWGDYKLWMADRIIRRATGGVRND